MKRILVLLALLGALAAPGRLAAQQIHVGLGGQLSSIVHVPIVIPVVADLTGRPERLGSYSLRLQWNPAVLQITGGADGTFGGATVNDDSLTAGVLRMAGVNSAGAAGLVTLVNIELLPLVKAVDTLKLTLTGLYAAGTFADLDSLAVVTNGVYCPARGLWGDIDGDGNANSRDALIALSNAVGLDVSAFDISLGDVDGNGLTNARDALIILSNAVGVDVSAYRVMRLAGGACSAFTGLALSVTPGPVELVRGQTVKFEAWAADSVTGALQAVANPSWKTNAPFVLVVGPSGEATARDTGTAVVTALRGLRDSAQTTVHVIDRRTTHWVDAAAVNAKNRLGTTDLPFGSIDEGLQFAQDGDTLRIRLGSYHAQNGTLFLNRPVVLLGDTAADGTRPVLVADSGAFGWDGDAIDVMTPGRVEVQNLAFTGALTGVYVSGGSCVLLRGVRMNVYSYGVYVDAPIPCVRIEHSVLLGPDYGYLDAPVAGSAAQRSPVQRVAGSPAYYYGGAGVYVYAPLDTLTIEDTEIAGFDYGVNLDQAPDSTTIRRSSLHDFIDGAVVSSPCYGECAAVFEGPAARPGPRARAAARAPRAGVARPQATGPSGQPPAVLIEWSRLARSSYGYLVDLEVPVRRVAFAHNVMTNPNNSAVYVDGSVYGPAANRGYLSMVGDSIVAPPESQHDYWLSANYLDSLTIDSVQVVGADYGYTYDVTLVRMTNSTLRDVRSYGLEVDFGSTPGGTFQLANDTVVGDPRDDAQVDALEHYGARLVADRVTVINAAEGIDADYSDSSTTITNSVFRHVEYPIYWELNTYPGPSASTLTVTHSTFDGFAWGIEAYEGRMVVDSNTFVNGQQPIYLESARPIAVRGNALSASPNGIDLYTYDSTTTVTVAGNVLSGIASQGIYVSGNLYPDSLQTVLDVRGNTVTCDAAGATGVAGIELYDAHMTVTDNQVSNCYEGIRTVVALNTPRSDSIVHNTVTAPASAHFGIGAAGSIVARIGRNTVTGAGTGGQTAALIDADGPCGWWECPDYGPSVVTIDSNVVSGGTNFGIRAQDSDSLVILGNTVQNLNSPTAGYNGYPQDVGAITVMGALRGFAQVLGNVVKTIAGSGIVIDHYSYDGVVVQVDSNVVADLDTIPLSLYGGSGVLAFQGPTLITRNLLTGARRDGVRIMTGGDSVGVTGNNIAGNQPYGVVVDCDCSSRDALENYWGDPMGPRGVFSPDSSLVGDFVIDGNVNWSPFRVLQNDSAPTTVPPAPRFLAGARALPVARVAGRSGQGAAFPRRDRFPAERPAARQSAAMGAASASEPGAQHRAAQQQARAERAAQRAQRIQEVRARIEARDAARRAAQAAHAARAAAHTASPGGTRSQGVRP